MGQVLHRCLPVENHSKHEFPDFQCNIFLQLAVLGLELKLGIGLELGLGLGLGLGVIPSIEVHMHGPLSQG